MLVTGLLLWLACENKSNNNQTTNNPKYIKTLFGGCNGQDFPDLKRSYIEEEDTVIFSIVNDTLDIYVGLNYICCAPFTTDASITNDSILMNLNDTCSSVYQTCYCRCMCYYTWDFLFADFQKKEYYFKIVLHEPREEDPITVKEGYIDLETIN